MSWKGLSLPRMSELTVPQPPKCTFEFTWGSPRALLGEYWDISAQE